VDAGGHRRVGAVRVPVECARHDGVMLHGEVRASNARNVRERRGSRRSRLEGGPCD
jgi:hypothetical protein